MTALYKSIQHEVSLEALLYFLTGDMGLHAQQIHFLVNLVQLILTHNYFIFLDSFFLQIRGTAMGASFAPIFAKLFMGY